MAAETPPPESIGGQVQFKQCRWCKNKKQKRKWALRMCVWDTVGGITGWICHDCSRAAEEANNGRS